MAQFNDLISFYELMGAAIRAGMLMKWRHSGFNVFCGSRIQPGDEKAMASGS
jgi:hypothetical protein